MIAASIDQAIGYTQPAVLHWAQDVGENLYTHLALWEATFVQFDDTLPDERTVRNWKVPTQYALEKVPNANAIQTEFASEVIRIVYGATNAAREAALQGRITAGQLAQVLADWNTAWSF